MKKNNEKEKEFKFEMTEVNIRVTEKMTKLMDEDD